MPSARSSHLSPAAHYRSTSLTKTIEPLCHSKSRGRLGLCCAALRISFRVYKLEVTAAFAVRNWNNRYRLIIPVTAHRTGLTFHCDCLTVRTGGSLFAQRSSTPHRSHVHCQYAHGDRRDFCRAAGKRPASACNSYSASYYRQRTLDSCAADSFNCSG